MVTPRTLERDSELGVLHAALAHARGASRRTVVITGSPGLGKTTLLDEFLAEVTSAAFAEPPWVARGECVEPHGEAEPYLPVLDAIAQLVRTDAGGAALATLACCAPLWLQQMPSLLDAETQAGLEERTRGAAPGRMLREMTEALEALSAQRTVILALEDLHDCDASTCALLRFVARRRQPARLLIAATLRFDEASAHVQSLLHDLRARGQLVSISLQPLSESAVAKYVTSRMPDPPDAGTLAQVYERTRGHPLLLDRLVESVRAGEQGVPDSLRGFALDRIASLPPELRETAEVASVAGSEFAAAELAACLDVGLEEAERRCSELTRRAQLLEARGAAEWREGAVCGRYRYTHELLRQAVYESLDEARRAHLHRVIARTLAASQGEHAATNLLLLHHLEAGRDVPGALRQAERAAQLAWARQAPEEASRHWLTALRLLGQIGAEPARELELRLALGRVARAVPGARFLQQNYTRARALCLELGSTEQLMAAVRGLVEHYQATGQQGLARAEAEQLLRSCAEQPGAGLAQAHISQVASVMLQGDYLRALEHASRAIAEYRAEDRDEHAQRFGGFDPAVAALAWSAPVLWLLGFPDASLECAQLGVAVAERTCDTTSIALASYALARVLAWRGGKGAARERLELARQLSEREHAALSSWLIQLAWVESAVAPEDPGQAVRLLSDAIQGAEQAGIRFDVPHALCMLAEAQLRAGQCAAAQRTLDSADDLSQSSGELCRRPEIAFGRARCALANRASELAEQWLERTLQAARELHASSWELRAALLLAREPLFERAPEARRATLLQAYSAFDEGFDSEDLRLAQHRLSELGAAVLQRVPSPRRGLIAGAWNVLRTRGRELAGEAPSPGRVEPAAHPRSSSAPPPGRGAAPSPPPAALVRQGDFWTVQFEGRTCHVKDSRGIGLLVRLLSAPCREVHVLDLAAEPSAGDVGPDEQDQSRALRALRATDGIDRQARAAYQARARELSREIEQARVEQDRARLSALQSELDFLTLELSRSYGRSGRRRATGTPAERARVNVTRAIKSATRRIAGHHPSLADHLSRCVRTGTFCVYAPEAERSIEWQIQRVP